MFSQVSKISASVFLLFVVLFQHFAVGSTIADIERESDQIITQDSIATESISFHADTLRSDTNVADEEVLKSMVKYHALDSMSVDIENTIVYLYGNATVDYEDLHLKADRIVIDMDKKEMFAQGTTDSSGNVIGSPVFSQKEQQFKSSNIRYNFATKKGKIGYVITREGEGYIHGDVVKKDAYNNFYIHNGQYTTCDLDTPHFSIYSRRLKVINNNKIITGPAYLMIEQIPTPLLIPFGFFPNKKGRSSGVIFPAFGESAQRGFYFQRLGYYFGFSDYFNLALTGDIYTKGSYTSDVSSTYKKRYKYTGNLRLSYAYSVTSEKELPDYSVTKDFHINWTHSKDAKANPNNTFTANVNAGTSKYYQNTISSVNNFLSNTFQSGITFSHQFPNLPINYALNASHLQNTITKDISITAPDFSFNVSRITPFKRQVAIGGQKWYEKIGTSVALRASNNIQTKDSLLFREESLHELKNGAILTVPVNTSFNVLKFYTLSPSLAFTDRMYLKSTEYKWDNENRTIDTITNHGLVNAYDYQAALSLTTRIYGMYQFHKGKILAIRHVMTPTLSLAYRPDFSKSSFGYYKKVQTDTLGTVRKYSVFQNGIYGGPSSGKYGNLSYGLDNNLEMKVKTSSDTGSATKKIKIFESLRIAGNYNFIADSMKFSPVTFSGRTILFDKFSVNFGGTLDPYAYDWKNIDYDKYQYSINGKLVRLTAANLSLNFSLNRSKKDKSNSKFSQTDIDYINQHPEEYIDFEIPYNLAVSYLFNYSKQGSLASNRTQTVSMNGDVNLTPQWKIGFNSWYDITHGKFTNLGLNIYRDLHCWEMRMNWIPFGYQESWNFQINVKSAILQDLKLLKRKDFYDQ